MKKEFGVMYNNVVKVETVKLCPKCDKQSYHVKLNRAGLLLSGKCVLCGYNEKR